jgi:phosphatidylethanolamine-binding protein (PEBP) family uncharacterized protein
MRQQLRAISGAVLLAMLALAGCGGISSGDGSSSSPTALTKITLDSPALTGTSLPARYTCDGENIPPPLQWGAVPPATRELALFLLALKPTHVAGEYSISVEWAVAGLDPGRHSLAAGHLPPGVRIGRASHGRTRYSLCPQKGTTAHYQFELYAVPRTLTIPANFQALQTLSKLATGDTSTTASARGGFTVSYARA